MTARSLNLTAARAVGGQYGLTVEGLLGAAPEALVVVDQGGVIRFVSRQAEVLFGYDQKALVGQLVEMLVPSSFRSVHPGLRGRFVADAGTREMGTGHRVSGRRSDGSDFAMDISLAAVGTGDDQLVIAAVRDMTARDDAEQGRRQSERMAAMVEFNADAIFSGTVEGMITSWNPAAERLFGYPSTEIVGRSCMLLSPTGRTEPGSLLSEIISIHLLENFETDLVRRDGSKFPASLTVSPIYDDAGVLVGTSAIARDVTEQQQAFTAAQRIAAIVENSGDAIISKTLDGIITSWNPAAERMYGYSAKEVMGKPIGLLTRADEMSEILARISAGERIEHLETTRVRKDATQIPVSLSVSPICSADGTLVGVSTIARDLSEREQAARTAASLTAAEDLVQTVLGSAAIGIALTGLDGFFRMVNRSLCDLLGYDEAWFLAHQVRDIIHPGDLEGALEVRDRVMGGSADPCVAELRLVRVDGATVWVRYVRVRVPDGAGRPNLIMIQVQDISAEHEAHEALVHQAFHDQLTGLHNRAWILDILASDLLASQELGTRLGVLFLDLDNLKVVNDSLGHTAGDEVLTTAANRILQVCRPGDRIGRFGGDSFVVIVQNVLDVLDLERFAQRLSDAVAAEMYVRGHRLVQSVSIGIAVSSVASTSEALLRDADSALGQAKAGGRAKWQFFDDAMHGRAVARLTVEAQLRDAITSAQFVVHYQPIVALSDFHVVGHEALVRWAHPTRGLLRPAEFIDVAEASGLINAIGAQVLDQACAMLAGHPDLPGPVSVNVSAVQLAAPQWQRAVAETMSRHRVDPTRIVIEVTETAALSLTDCAMGALRSLSEIGVGIHLDDFGTGYSSISVLRDLPVTGVKLDLRFVHDLTAATSQANALTQGLSGLLNGMHLTGIAEGIETRMQARILRAQGWECGQGYYFGKPSAIPATDVHPAKDLTA